MYRKLANACAKLPEELFSVKATGKNKTSAVLRLKVRKSAAKLSRTNPF